MDMPQGKQTVSDEEIITIISQHPDPAFTTGELAELFGMSTEGIRGRLSKLQDKGLISKKKPTNRTVIWWSLSDEQTYELSK
jgi:predicted HTH transcriptional regulator